MWFPAEAPILFLNLLCLAAVGTYLWRYFGFVGFDLAKFEPPTPLARIWNVFLAVGFPLIALSFAMSEDRKRTLVGIGIATILVPAILPDVEPPETHSAFQWVYLRTIGKAFADFIGTTIIYILLLICSVFGFYWVAAYAGIAGLFGVSKLAWIQMQAGEASRPRQIRFGSLTLMFFAAFGWILFLTTQVQLARADLQSELKDLYGPVLWPIVGNWFLARFPRLAAARRLRSNI